MPQCPICHAAIWVGQRYCSTCDNYLPTPEEKDHFCPQCGIRMPPQQDVCHKCNASLSEMPGASFPRRARTRRFSPWVLGIFIGIGLVIAALLLFFHFNKSPGPSALMAPSSSPLASGQIPTTTSPPKAATAPPPPTAPAAQEPVVPSAPASPSPPELTTPIPSPPKYFVNVNNLALRDGPTMSAPIIAILKFKDEVELLDTSGGWGKIRALRRNMVGWSYMYYLVPVPADRP
jgi:predicted nucleic acid-binding Zn ribbon protein